MVAFSLDPAGDDIALDECAEPVEIPHGRDGGLVREPEVVPIANCDLRSDPMAFL